MGNELKHFFEALNKNCTYLVLRNWNDVLDDAKYGNSDDDIDILCEDKNAFVSYTNAYRIHKNKYRDNYFVKCGSLEIRLDIRWVGDGYYPKEWEKLMLSRRVKNEQGVFILNHEDYYNSLAYHALFQKKEISQKYLDILCKEYNLPNNVCGQQNIAHQKILDSLNRFMVINHFKFSIPSDPAVYINWPNIKKSRYFIDLKLLFRRLFYKAGTWLKIFHNIFNKING